jgi:subtilase family serine protease
MDALGSGETTLDAEQSGAIAPQANIIVYQAPNTDYGVVDGYFTAASQNIADTVSASWGESETDITASVNEGIESDAYAGSFDEAYLELAAQGQSAFVSSGDDGACTADEDLGTTNLSAGNPDSSPWITAAGGTISTGSPTTRTRRSLRWTARARVTTTCITPARPVTITTWALASGRRTWRPWPATSPASRINSRWPARASRPGRPASC